MPPRRKLKPRSPEQENLGAAVEQLRKEAGLTQEQFADLAATTFTRVGALERGQANPTFMTLQRIAKALDVEPSFLLSRAESLADKP